jgi:hypothetical protein
VENNHRRTLPADCRVQLHNDCFRSPGLS